MDNWRMGQGFEDIRAMGPEEQAEQDYYNRLDQNTTRQPSKIGSLTEELSDAEFGKQAKQQIRDNEVATAVATQKDAETAPVMNEMYARLQDALQYKNAVLNSNSLAMRN